MQAENASHPFCGEAAEPVEEATLRGDVEASWATWRPGELPHPAAGRPMPTVAMITAAVRAPERTNVLTLSMIARPDNSRRRRR
jgi:hypothetical protein